MCSVGAYNHAVLLPSSDSPSPCLPVVAVASWLSSDCCLLYLREHTTCTRARSLLEDVWDESLEVSTYMSKCKVPLHPFDVWFEASME